MVFLAEKCAAGWKPTATISAFGSVMIVGSLCRYSGTEFELRRYLIRNEMSLDEGMREGNESEWSR